MRFFRFLFFTFILLWMLIGCRQSTSPPVKSDITLTAEFTGVTEAWIKLHNPAPQAGTVLQLWRGEQLVFSGGGSITDTTVADSGLAPAQSYRYRARLLKEGALLRTGPELTLTTMDTTSHDFTWEVIEFPSPFGSGGLYDVAIINENDIWAVGRIYSDSAKPWLPYNAVHWDGEKWELKRIKTNACGGVEYPPIRTIFRFPDNSIVFGHIDASLTYYNGTTFNNDCSFINKINGSINKMWGTSSNDFYIVGNNGLIAHYDGSNWRRIESGTTLPIQDIWGAKEPNTNDYVIYCAVSNLINVHEAMLLKINKQSVVEKLPWFTGRAVISVWFDNPNIIFTCGSGIMRKAPNNKWIEIGDAHVIPSQTGRIRGKAINDIFVVSDFGHIGHYNGIDFKVIQPTQSIFYHSCDYKENLFVAVGSPHTAYITIVKKLK